MLYHLQKTSLEYSLFCSIANVRFEVDICGAMLQLLCFAKKRNVKLS